MRFAMSFGLMALLSAQTGTKTRASDYPARVQMDAVTLAAGSLGHSLPTPQGVLQTDDYLVIEVAFFGPPMSRLRVSPDNFTLRINGRGAPLPAQLPGMVAGTIKFRKPDPREPVTAIRSYEEDSIEHRVRNASLPEGEKTMPRSGLIYFAHRGKTGNIRYVQLLYNGPMGKSSLKLLP